MDEIMTTDAGTLDMGTPALPVDEKRLVEFDRVLQRYRAGKKHLESRVVAAENWWKLRNEAEAKKQLGGGWDDSFRARSAWLHNIIVSKHADAMENYPEPLVLPREPGDRAQARMLSAVLPVVLEQANFESVYDANMWQKLKTGTGVYQVAWDPDLCGGLGDISVRRVDLLSIFWEPGVTDIQRSRFVFHVELQDNELLEARYPHLKGKLRGAKPTLTRFLYDDAVSTEGKSAVVDVYYKLREDGKTVLHYCKYVGDQVLASTENDGSGGLYDHGLYPFVFDPLWPVEGSPCGYGYVDISMNPQIQLDLLDTAFLRNAMNGANPRYFRRAGSSVNLDQFRDVNQSFVDVTGALDDTGIRPIDCAPLAGSYLGFYQNKVAELRETSGNTESANGLVTGGVTAASAIAALQEASGKTSRDAVRASYRAFAGITAMMIELIRQFYDLPRQFRIVGDNGVEDFAAFDNSALTAQPVGDGEMGWRLPVFDIKVKIQKRNAYTRVSQNELALQLYSLGFFEPDRAVSAAACLEMMDFEGRDELRQRISRSADLSGRLERMTQAAFALVERYEPQNLELFEELAEPLQSRRLRGTGRAGAKGTRADGGGGAKAGGESGMMRRARERANRAADADR